MTAAQQRRWVCPNAETTGCAGIHAPGRMRRDDVRRYCIPCSVRTGRLVERTCPALDRERDRKASARRDKRATVAAKTRSKAVEDRTFGGIDMVAEAKRMWALPALREYHRGRRLPTLEFRQRHRGAYSTGRAWPNHIVVTFGGTPSDMLSVLLHELAHAADPKRGHTDQWGAIYLNAARQRWGPEWFRFPVPSSRLVHGLTDQITTGIAAARAAETVG